MAGKRTQQLRRERRAPRGFFHVVLVLLFMFGVVAYGVLQSQTELVERRAEAPKQTGAALSRAREGLIEYASREALDAPRDVADTHPKYNYYNIYSSADIDAAAPLITDTTDTGLLAQSYRAAVNDRFVVWRPGQLPCPDVLGDDPTVAASVSFVLWSDDDDFDGIADYDDTLCSSPAAPRTLAGGVPDGGLAGRLPWREYYDNLTYARAVGTGDLRDSNNDRLWYQVAPIATDVRRPLSPYRIIRDDDSWLQVTVALPDPSSETGAIGSGTDTVGTLMLNRIAAAVISPGEPFLGVQRVPEDYWFSGAAAGRADAHTVTVGADQYLEGPLVGAAAAVVAPQHRDRYAYVTADELLQAFDGLDRNEEMSRIANALRSFEQRQGFLPTPATYQRENALFISRRLGRASEGIHDNLSGPVKPAADVDLQGAAILYDTRPVTVGTGTFDVRTAAAFDDRSGQALVSLRLMPRVRLSPHAISLAAISLSRDHELAPPFGELQLTTSLRSFFEVGRFNVVLPPYTPMIAASPYLAYSQSDKEAPDTSGANPRLEVGGTRIRGEPLANAVFADLAPSSSSELSRDGYALKMNEGSLLYTSDPVTLASRGGGFGLVGADGRSTLTPVLEYRAEVAPTARIVAGLAIQSTVVNPSYLGLPPERTALVPGNQGLLPAAALPNQITPALLTLDASRQLQSNEPGFMESYFHELAGAQTARNLTLGLLEVEGSGAIGYFPGAVTMRGYRGLTLAVRNALETTNAGFTDIAQSQPRITPHAFNAAAPPTELTVHGMIEMPAGTKFFYPAGYQFALGRASFIHTSGIPREDGQPNRAILRAPDQYDLDDYDGGAIVHLPPGAVLHDVSAAAGAILPDGMTLAAAADDLRVVLPHGGSMRYAQLLHVTPGHGDSVLPRTPEQASFRVEIEMAPPAGQTTPGFVPTALQTAIAAQRDWHLLYPYHGFVAVKSQRMMPLLTLDATGELTVAVAATSRIQNVLARANLSYIGGPRADSNPAPFAGVYSMLSTLTLNAAPSRVELNDLGLAYSLTDFRGVGTQIAALAPGEASLTVLASVASLPPLQFDIGQGVNLAVNPADLWLNVEAITLASTVTISTSIDAYDTDGALLTQPIASTVNIAFNAAILQADLRGHPLSKAPFVAPGGRRAPDESYPDATPLTIPSAERALHFSDRHAIGATVSTVPDDEIPLFFGMDTRGSVDNFLTVTLANGRVAVFETDVNFGAANFAQIELDTDAVMRTNFTAGTADQVLPAGTRVIFDYELVGATVTTTMAVTVIVTLSQFPPLDSANARSITVDIAALSVMVSTGPRLVEQLIPRARVSRGAGFYPVPDDTGVVFFAPTETHMQGLPEIVTIVLDTEPFLPDSPAVLTTTIGGGVQTLIGTDPRIIVTPGSKMPRIARRGMPLRMWSPLHGFDFPHVVGQWGGGAATLRAVGGALPGVRQTMSNYYTDFQEVVAVSEGARISFSSLEAMVPSYATITVGVRTETMIASAALQTVGADVSFITPPKFGFILPLTAAGMPNLLAVASEGGAVVRDYLGKDLVLANILPGQIVRSRSGGGAGASRIELNYSALDGNLEYEDLQSDDLIFAQNNPLFYAVAGECRDLVALNEPTGACAEGAGEGLTVDVYPGEAVELPSDTIAPANLLILGPAATDGRQLEMELSYIAGGAARTVPVSGLQLLDTGVLVPLDISNVSSTVSAEFVEVRVSLLTTPLSADAGTTLVITPPGDRGLRLLMRDSSLGTDVLTLTTFDPSTGGAVEYFGPLEVFVGGYTAGNQAIAAHSIAVDTSAGDLTLGIGSLVRYGFDLQSPAEAGDGSVFDDGTDVHDLGGYEALPNQDFDIRVTVQADTPLFYPGYDTSYRTASRLAAGEAITLGGGAKLVSLLHADTFVELTASAINMGPPGYAWQGVVFGPTALLRPSGATSIAVRSAPVRNEAALVAGLTVAKELNQPMPMGLFARRGEGDRARAVSYGSVALLTERFDLTYDRCFFCAPAVVTTALYAPGLPFPPPNTSVNGVQASDALITVTVSAVPTTVVYASYTITVVTRTTLDASPVGAFLSTTAWRDEQALNLFEITLRNFSPAYVQGSVIVAGDAVVVNLSPPPTNPPGLGGVDLSYRTLVTLDPGGDPVQMAREGRPGTVPHFARSVNSTVIGQFDGNDDGSFLRDAYSAVRDSTGADFFPAALHADTQLAERTVFSFGRYGGFDLDAELPLLDNLPGTEATVVLPLPLNIHSTNANFAAFDNAGASALPVAYTITTANPVNPWTADFAQIYVDSQTVSSIAVVAPGVGDMDVQLHVPVPVAVVGSVALYGGSLINLRDRTAFQAKRFQSTVALTITLGTRGGEGSVVGGAGSGRPQIVGLPRVLRGSYSGFSGAGLGFGLGLSVGVYPEQFVDNFALSQTLDILPGTDEETLLVLADLTVGVIATDDTNPRALEYDMRMADAVVIDVTRGANPTVADVPSLYDLADVDDPIQGDQHGFLPAGHRLLLPRDAVITILPPLNVPREHDYSAVTIDAYPLPAGTRAVFDAIIDHDYRMSIEATFQRTGAEVTVALDTHAVPFHFSSIDRVLDVSGTVTVSHYAEEIDLVISAESTVNVTYNFSPTVTVEVTTIPQARARPLSAENDTYQNLWIRVLDTVTIEDDGLTITLRPGSVINPILGTYLPQRAEQRAEPIEQVSLVMTAPADIKYGRRLTFVRPALILPAGLTLRTGPNVERFTNVKAVVAHSPSPLDSPVDCGIPDKDTGTSGGNDKVNQILEGRTTVGITRITAVATDASIPSLNLNAGDGHPCMLLDLFENTDQDSHFIYTSRQLADNNGRIRANDVMRMVGGRLQP